MRFGKITLAAIAAASLVSAPVMAAAAPSKAVAVSKVKRVGAVRKTESKLGGGSGVLVAILAAAAVVGGIVIAASSKSPRLFNNLWEKAVLGPPFWLVCRFLFPFQLRLPSSLNHCFQFSER